MRGVSLEHLQISASMLKGLPEFSSKANLNFDSIARTVGLTGLNTEDDFEYVSLDAFAQYLEIASIMSGNEAFGLQFANVRGTAPTGPLSFALANAPDVRTALLSLLKYIPTRLDVTHADVVIESERLIIDWGFSPLLVRRWQFCDYTVSTTIRRVNLLTDSRWRPLAVRLMRPPPRNLDPYRRTLGRSLEFSQPTNSIVLPAAILDIANLNPNAALFAMSCQLLDKILADRSINTDFITGIREEIITALPSEEGAQLTRVARRSGLSVRTLQRYLGEHGTSFQELVNDTRKSLALRYLEDSELSVSQVSYQLGFSAPSAFTRACYRWFGRRPSAVRQELHQGVSSREEP
jgi:AraC-like DNA-binding protein